MSNDQDHGPEGADAGDAPFAGGDAEWSALMFLMSRIGRVNELFLAEVQEGLVRTSSRGHAEAECFVLMSLLVNGPSCWLSPTTLSAYSLQTPGGMTKTLGRLEASGLVRRRLDKADRRALHVGLTPKGLRLSQKLFNQTVAHYAHAFGAFSPDDRHQMAKTLRTMLTALEKATGKESTEHWVKVE
jgi:DNA-binding MarR family transcriptional regulator